MRALRLANAPRWALQGVYQSRLSALGAYVPEVWGGNDPAKWAKWRVLGVPELSV